MCALPSDLQLIIHLVILAAARSYFRFDTALAEYSVLRGNTVYSDCEQVKGWGTDIALGHRVHKASQNQIQINL
jgi:hypothetical protein